MITTFCPASRANEQAADAKPEPRRSHIGQFFSDLLKVYMGMIGISHPDDLKRQTALARQASGAALNQDGRCGNRTAP